MTLVKTQQPPNINLGENPVLFGFKTTNQIQQAGVRAEFSLFFGGMPTLGHILELLIDGKTHQFTFVGAPGNDPYELPLQYTGVGFGTFDGYLGQVKDEILKNPYFSKYYNITVQGGWANPYLLFIAKQVGSRYTISLVSGPGSFFTTNSLLNVAGVDQVLRPFYGVYLQCYVDGILAGEDLLAPSSDGTLQYDVSAYLKAHATPSFTWPPSTGYLKKRPELLKRFWVRFADRYGVPASINKLQSTQGFISYALPGGAGYMQNSQYQLQNTNFWDSLQYNKRFITNQPVNKRVKLDQIEKLFFLNYQHTTPIRLRVSLEFFDALGVMVDIDLETLSVQKFEVLEINFTLQKILDLLPAPVSQLHKAEICMMTGTDTKVSETRTYYTDYLAERHSHYFIFRNSLGVYDCDLFTGRHQQMVSSEKQVFQLTNRYSFTRTDAPSSVMRSTETELFGASTGWTDDTNRVNWLRELLLSKEVYEVIDDILFPVVVTSAEVDLVTTGKTLHNVQIEYARAYTDEHFSKITGIAAAKFIQSFNQANDPQFNPIQPVPTP
jgi:hypothetical protein